MYTSGMQNSFSDAIVDSFKYDKVNGWECMRKIKYFLLEHEGEKILYYHLDGKKIPVPKIAEIYQIFPCVVLLRYKVYDPYGEFRQYVYDSISYIDLYCRHAQIKVFGRI